MMQMSDKSLKKTDIWTNADYLRLLRPLVRPKSGTTENEVFRTNRHPCIISLSPRENVVSVVMLTRSNEGEQGAPSGDSRGPWGGHLGHGDD